jgi:hypothetical protein
MPTATGPVPHRDSRHAVWLGTIAGSTTQNAPENSVALQACPLGKPEPFATGITWSNSDIGRWLATIRAFDRPPVQNCVTPCGGTSTAELGGT